MNSLCAAYTVAKLYGSTWNTLYMRTFLYTKFCHWTSILVDFIFSLLFIFIILKYVMSTASVVFHVSRQYRATIFSIVSCAISLIPLILCSLVSILVTKTYAFFSKGHGERAQSTIRKQNSKYKKGRKILLPLSKRPWNKQVQQLSIALYM